MVREDLFPCHGISLCQPSGSTWTKLFSWCKFAWSWVGELRTRTRLGYQCVLLLPILLHWLSLPFPLAHLLPLPPSLPPLLPIGHAKWLVALCNNHKGPDAVWTSIPMGEGPVRIGLPVLLGWLLSGSKGKRLSWARRGWKFPSIKTPNFN